MIHLLGNRESDVMLLRASGLTFPQIAKRLRIRRRAATEHFTRGVARLHSKVPSRKLRRRNSLKTAVPCHKCNERPRLEDRIICRRCYNDHQKAKYHNGYKGKAKPRVIRKELCSCKNESCNGMTCDVIRL